MNQLGVLAVLVAVLWPALASERGRPVPRRPSELTVQRPRVGATVAAIVVVCVVAGLIAGPLLGVAVPIVGLVAWRERARHRVRCEQRDREFETLRFLDEVTASVRAGGSLAASVSSAGQRASRCGSSAGWRQVYGRIEAGRSLPTALDEVFESERPVTADERLVASTIVALDSTGAPALDALERAGDAMRDRASSREDARTQAQQAFSSAAVLSALPAAFGLVAALAEPDVAELYTQRWIGAFCVVVSAGFTLAGWEWLQRLLDGAR